MKQRFFFLQWHAKCSKSFHPKKIIITSTAFSYFDIYLVQNVLKLNMSLLSWNKYLLWSFEPPLVDSYAMWKDRVY